MAWILMKAHADKPLPFVRLLNVVALQPFLVDLDQLLVVVLGGSRSVGEGKFKHFFGVI